MNTRSASASVPDATLPLMMGYRFEPRSAMKTTCSSLAEFLNLLRDEIEAGKRNGVFHGTSTEVAIHPNATIPLVRPKIGPYAEGGEQDLPAKFKTNWVNGHSGRPDDSDPHIAIGAIIGVAPGRDRLIVQRAASRGIVAAIEATDGFKYTFNNSWASKDDDGQRFSYICQDSMQNKDRHANGFNRTQKHLRGDQERGIRKPTYDCRGAISVKFSSTKGYMEIQYRHLSVHPTVEERKPAPARVSMPNPPRPPAVDPPPDPTSHEDPGGLVGRLVSEMAAFVNESSQQAPPPPAPAIQRDAPNISRPLKRKRETRAPSSSAPAAHASTQNLSLVDLLRLSETQRHSPQEDSAASTRRPVEQAPPVPYHLPLWQNNDSTPSTTTQSGPSTEARRQTHSKPQRPQASLAAQPSNASNPSDFRDSNNSTAAQKPANPPRDRKPKPRGHALFSTLKPTAADTADGAFVLQNMHRGRSACVNCRNGKKKCDEQRPSCGACRKSNKLDCVYEGVQFAPSLEQQFQQWQFYPSPDYMQGAVAEAGVAAVPTLSQSGGDGGSGPWFPNR